MKPVILDCDPGHDDMVAILLAAASPAIELLAITTVAGNGTLERTTYNARATCSLAGIRDVPIAAGAAARRERAAGHARPHRAADQRRASAAHAPGAGGADRRDRPDGRHDGRR